MTNELQKEIKGLIAKEGLKHKQLAELWGVNIQQVSLMVNGHAPMSAERINKLVNKYNYYITITKSANVQQ